MKSRTRAAVAASANHEIHGTRMDDAPAAASNRFSRGRGGIRSNGDGPSSLPSSPLFEDPKYFKRKRQHQQQRFFGDVLLSLFLCLVSFGAAAGVLLTLLFPSHFHSDKNSTLQRRKNTSVRQQQKHLLVGGGGDSLSKSSSWLLPRRLRSKTKTTTDDANHPAILALSQVEDAIQHNRHSDNRINSDLLMTLLDGTMPNPLLRQTKPKANTPKFSMHGQFFRTTRLRKDRMDWQTEWDQLLLVEHAAAATAAAGKTTDQEYWGRPTVDYTHDYLYEYPKKLLEPPATGYPQLLPLSKILEDWPQDADVDFAAAAASTRTPPIRETLQHFDFNTELDVALLFRNRKLPFKLTHVPELLDANQKWTDDYVSREFDASTTTVHGKCQESAHSFFAFFLPNAWDVQSMGLPPTRNNDFTFRMWAEHARYADATRLDPHRPHFYWQAGVPTEERELPLKDWSFVSRDLPSFSSPNATFVSFNPSEQKGIQCRFGERGVVAATHFDAGQNMVGMITGAKRYILHPPRECSRLGIVTYRNSAIFRHSLLNFGRHNNMDAADNMDPREKAWLDRAATSQAVQTVLKSGEILFIPSHWFHYIIGLQKNAQCNVRSGVDLEGDEEFGGAWHVSEEKCDPLRKANNVIS